MDSEVEKKCVERLKALGIHEKIVRHDLLPKLIPLTLTLAEVERIRLEPELYSKNPHEETESYPVVSLSNIDDELLLSRFIDDGYEYMLAVRKMQNHLEYIPIYRLVWLLSRGQGFYFLNGMARLK